MEREFEHRLTEVEERSKSNTHRLDEVERRQESLDKLTTSVSLLAEREERKAYVKAKKEEAEA